MRRAIDDVVLSQQTSLEILTNICCDESAAEWEDDDNVSSFPLFFYRLKLGLHVQLSCLVRLILKFDQGPMLFKNAAVIYEFCGKKSF